MEKGVSLMIFVVVLLSISLLVYFAIESKNSSPKVDGQIPYSNVASGFFYELTPASLLDSKDEVFWEKNKLVKTQFFIESKFGQYEEAGNIYSYTLSNSEDCEKEFDKREYPVSNYFQTSNFNPGKYEIHKVRFCWIENVSPTEFECSTPEIGRPCLYSCQVSCVCTYAESN